MSSRFPRPRRRKPDSRKRSSRRRRAKRPLTSETLEARNLLAADLPFQNADVPLDVNGDGHVSPIDALIVINEMNAHGARLLASSGSSPAPTAAAPRVAAAFSAPAPSPAAMVDVNGDNHVSSVDALMVINALTGDNVTVVGDPTLNIGEGDILDIPAATVLGNDILGPGGGALQITSLEPLPAATTLVSQSTRGATVTLDLGTTAAGDEVLTYDPTTSQQLRDLTVGATLSDSFTYNVGDGLGSTDTATVTLSVTGGANEVKLDLNITDESGGAITIVETGDRFFLEGMIQDLNGGGVFSAFRDVTFNTGLAEVVPRETQTILLDGTVIGGSFTLTFDGQTTGDIDVQATQTADQVKDALEALGNIPVDSLDVTVDKNENGETFWEVTFGGDFAGMPVPNMTADDSALQGTGAVVITESSGVDLASPADQLGAFTFFDPYLNGRTGGINAEGFDELGSVTELDAPGAFIFDQFRVLLEAKVANDDTETVMVGSTLNPIDVLANDIAGGTLTFASEAAEEKPGSDITVFGTDVAISPGLVEYGSDSVTVDAGGSLTITGLDISGTLGEVRINDGGTVGDPTDDFIEYDAPAAPFAGQDSFKYIVTDGNGKTDTATVTVGVGGPIANDDTHGGIEDQTTAGNVITGSDTHTGGLQFTVTDFDAVSDRGAAVSVQANGDFTYNPSGLAVFNVLSVGQSLSDTFTYTITDTAGDTDTATVNVTVAGRNDLPTAQPISDSIQKDETATGSLLTGATDPDGGDTLGTTPVSTTTPLGASLVITSGGGYTYDPSGSATLQALLPGETEMEVFTYTLDDGEGGTDTSTLTITTSGVNLDPVARNDSGAGFNFVSDDPAALVDVLGNDTDPEGVSLDILSVNTAGTQGLVSLDTVNDQVTYDPNGAFDGLGPADTDTTTFTYTISDGFNTDTATVTISITGKNDPPVARDDSGAGFTVSEDDGATPLDVLGNDTDPEGTALDVIAVDTAGTLGTATVDTVNDEVDYSPSGAFESLAAGATATDTFTYMITDGGETDTATVTVTITGENDGPTARNDTPTVTNMGSSLINALFNDTDPDTGDTLVITDVTTGSAGGTTSVTSVGGEPRISYTPTTLAGQDGVSETFDYTIRDITGATSTATVTVTVIANQPPNAENDMGATNEDTPTSGNVLDNDTDPEPDPITVTSFDSTSDRGAAVSVAAGGAYTYDPTGSAEIQGLSQGQVVTDTFSYTITDDPGGTDTATVTITLTGVADAPNAGPDSDSTTEDVAITIDVLDNDTDVDQGDTLSLISLSGATSSRGAGISIGPGGVTYDPRTSAELQSLAVGVVVSDTFSYTARDGDSLTDTATVTVTVTGVNDDPGAMNDSREVFQDMGPYTLDVLTGDTDPDSGDTFIITGVTQGSREGSVSISPGGGSVIYDHAPGVSGTETFTYTIDDGNGGTDTATVTVDVIDFVTVVFSGKIFVDDDGDGRHDAGELGISGVGVHLLNSSGQVVESQSTGADGSYAFTINDSGRYTVREDQPEGMLDGSDFAGSQGVSSSSNDRFTVDVPELGGVNFTGYNFTERWLEPSLLAPYFLLASHRSEGATLAVDASGNLLWYALEEGWEDVTALSLSVSPDGSTATLTAVDTLMQTFETTFDVASGDPRVNALGESDAGVEAFRLSGSAQDFFPGIGMSAPAMAASEAVFAELGEA